MVYLLLRNGQGPQVTAHAFRTVYCNRRNILKQAIITCPPAFNFLTDCTRRLSRGSDPGFILIPALYGEKSFRLKQSVNLSE